MSNYSVLGKFIFASVRNTKNKINVGSLYFEKGRIRLVHEDGPCIELNNSTRLQLVINCTSDIESGYYSAEELAAKFKMGTYDCININKDTLKLVETLKITVEEKKVQDEVDSNKCLLEIESEKDNVFWVHVSRGYPYVNDKLKKDNYEIIFNIVQKFEEWRKSTIDGQNETIQEICKLYKIFTQLESLHNFKHL